MSNTLSGLASGFDWSSLVDKLIAVARVPQNQLSAEKSEATAKSSALSNLKTLFSNVQTSVATLNSSDVFQKRSATVGSSSSGWSAEASAGTVQGDYAISVAKLATTTQLQGAVNAGRKLIVSPSTTADTVVSSLNLAQPITSGNFTVNGVKLAVATTDTLDDVFARLSADAGVTAVYDSGADGFTLTSDNGSEVTLGAANDTSNFLQALKLYNNGTPTVASATTLGIVRTGVSLAQSGLSTPITATDGTFSINGVSVAYSVSTDSVQNVLDRINASSAGVTASYDAAQDRFMLANKSTGDLGITLVEAPGGFLSALGLKGAGSSLVSGQNAEFTVNGGPTIISRSNTLDASAHGITGLLVTARSKTTETVSVGVDATSARGAIDDFVAKYNSLQSSIDSLTQVTTKGTKVSAATLAGNRDITEMGRALRAMLFTTASDNSGGVKRLADLGIDFSGTGSSLMVKDPTKLQNLLASSSSDVSTYFASSTGGLAKKMTDLLDKQLGSNGSFAVQTENLTRESAGLDAQIAAIERRLTVQRASLEASFIQMESVQSYLQQQADTLTRAFPANSN